MFLKCFIIHHLGDWNRNRTFQYLRIYGALRLLTHVGFLSETRSDTFRSVLINGKEQKSGKKWYIPVQKITFLRRFDRRNTFLDIEKSISKRLFSDYSKCKTVTRG